EGDAVRLARWHAIQRPMRCQGMARLPGYPLPPDEGIGQPHRRWSAGWWRLACALHSAREALSCPVPVAPAEVTWRPLPETPAVRDSPPRAPPPGKKAHPPGDPSPGPWGRWAASRPPTSPHPWLQPPAPVGCKKKTGTVSTTAGPRPPATAGGLRPLQRG